MSKQTTNVGSVSSWAQALAAGKLTTKQHKVLEDMVAEGKADSLQEAARLLDWQTEAIEHTSGMWGP